MRLNALSLSLLLLLLIYGCAPKLPEGAGDDLRKKLYYDANLAFSVAVPEEWDRSFISPPPMSPAKYAVFWRGAIDELPPRYVEMHVARLGDQNHEQLRNAALNDFKLAHPGFTLTAEKPLSDALNAPILLLGHTSSRSFQLVLFLPPDVGFMLDFSAPPEDFETYQPLFNLILDSFQPIKQP
ncbi:MAG TPA: hypothetical protein VJ995_00215 [Geothermobacteraceae bacterium]|nr:hypothetical protein [Geothermobacteraceae bacterium]